MFVCTRIPEEFRRGTCVTARQCSKSSTISLQPRFLSMRFSHFWRVGEIYGHRFASDEDEDVCDWVNKWFDRQPTCFSRMGLIVLSRNGINVQSHPNTTRAYRRLSLAALACLLAGKRAIILTLLPNTYSVISFYFPSGWSRASTYIYKAKTLAFADCDYCYTLVL